MHLPFPFWRWRRRPKPRQIVVVALEPGRGAGIERAFRWLGNTRIVDPAGANELFERLHPDLIVVELGVEGHAGDTAWHFRRALCALEPGTPLVVAISDLDAKTAGERADRIGAQATTGPDDAGALSRFVADQLAA